MNNHALFLLQKIKQKCWHCSERMLLHNQEMKKTTTNNDVNISFNSITEVVNYIDTVERTPYYKHYHKSDDNNYNFCGTHSMEEARELLLHGWDDGAKQLKDKLDAKVNVNNVGYRNKTFYDVTGFQCSKE